LEALVGDTSRLAKSGSIIYTGSDAKPPLREEQCGRRAYAPARSGDHRNTTHRRYLYLGPRDDGKHTG
jgi:hypothetical protein